MIGKGSFGTVYSGYNKINKTNIAIKLEKINAKSNLLENEAYFLRYLKGYGIPELKSFGVYGKYYVLIQTLLGNSLYSLYKNYKLCLKDICMIAIQILDRLEYIHSKYVIHQDIKPENFLMDLESKSIVYIIDFGLCKKYRSSHTGRHIKFSFTGKLIGTPGFASVNATRGAQQSRRDDLESLGYVLLYFLNNGNLPWRNAYICPNADKYEMIYDIKKNLKPEKLSKFFPKEFCEYLKYTRNLNFEQDPDYNYLRNLFCKILEKMNNTNDLKFSWLLIDKNDYQFSKTKKNNSEENKNDNNLKNKYNNPYRKKLVLNHVYYKI